MKRRQSDKDAVRSASSVEDLVEEVATKLHRRVSAAFLTYILVGAREEILLTALRVLGFTEKDSSPQITKRSSGLW